MKYLAIQNCQSEFHWSINWMSKVLEIPRSSYYQWLNRSKTSLELENHQIAQWIIELDEMFNHILGYRQMTLFINRLNHKSYNQKRIRRIMRLLGIKSVIRKKKHVYPPSNPEIIANNILARDFTASEPNQKWVSDITEFKDRNTKQKLYFCVILDLYDRSIVSYEISSRNNNELVFKTFEKAMASNPKAKPIFHSDRGFQYTSKVFNYKLKSNGLTQSMSRVGHCIDNGPIEGFWGIVKTEMYHHHKYENLQELKQAIHNYVYFYNHQRFQSRFKGQTPIEVREIALNSLFVKQYPIKPNNRIIKYYENIKQKSELIN